MNISHPPLFKSFLPLFLSFFILSEIFPQSRDDLLVLDAAGYYSELIKAIKGSKKSIHAALYTISLLENPPPGDKTLALLDEIIRASQRGIEVKIIIDYKGSASWKFGVRSFNAYYYLKEKGITVLFDNADIAMHSKMTVIDGALSFVGSSNWSDYAFEKNNELNILIRDPQTAAKVDQYISSIRLSPDFSSSRFSLPQSFLSKGDGPLIRLFSNESGLAFDLLTALACHRNETLTYETLSGIMGLKGSKNANRRALNRELRKLEKLNFIRLKTGFNQPFTYEFLIPLSGPEIPVPEEYFSCDWDGRLSTAAKLFLFIFLGETGGENQKFAWIESYQKFYGISDSIQDGIALLRKLGILTIDYSERKDGVHEARSLIRFNGLYDPEEREADILHLAMEYGSADLACAREWASIIYEGYNPIIIREILELKKSYPLQALDYAFRVVGAYTADNPCRSLKYVIGILRNPAKNWERDKT